MYCFRKVTNDLYWVGGSDRRIELFENIFPLKKGVSYNSYLLMDEKTVLFDAADYAIGRQSLSKSISSLKIFPFKAPKVPKASAEKSTLSVSS